MRLFIAGGVGLVSVVAVACNVQPHRAPIRTGF